MQIILICIVVFMWSALNRYKGFQSQKDLVKQKFKLFTLVTALSLFSLGITPYVLADTVQTTEAAEHIVVTGTRTAKLLSNSPVKVEVISSDEILRVSQGTVAQALNYVAGVVVTRSQKDGYNIQMQGFGGNQVLVLVNSQPVLTPTGSEVDLDQISVNDIERIEVMRGAGSVLYGSSAMGGVINIITNKAIGNSTKISYELANYHDNALDGNEYEHQTRLNISRQFGKWIARTNINLIDQPGFDYNKQDQKQSAASVDKIFADASLTREFSRFNAQAKLRYFTEDKFKQKSRLSVGEETVVTGYGSDVEQYQLDTAFWANNQAWNVNTRSMLHKEISGEESKRKTTIQLNEIDGKYVATIALKSNTAEIEWVNGGVAHFDGLDQYKLDENATVEIDDESRSATELYSQANYIQGDFQLLAGARAQYDTDFGWHKALRLSAMLKQNLGAQKINWRFGVGEGYRVPNLKERHYTFDHRHLGYMVLGNENLQPETSNQANVTVTWQTPIWNKQADFELESYLHFSKVENLIKTEFDLAATQAVNYEYQISSYQNIDRAKMKGFDISAKLSLTNWQYQFNYSYLDSGRLADRPRHQVKSNFLYQLPKYELDILLYWLYQADEAYSRENFTGLSNNNWSSWTLNFTQRWNENLSWRAGVDNIFDEHADEAAVAAGQFDAREVSSRRLYAGFTYQF
ncbi:TonB-dependent receptor plug domain-containing protein [Catenovulum agarivorans]|uniref:TonB-dependent receptor plug domain-containing protein n=1 Tax=Catenovulum agarivorans TaxID=1172192 RepID=UPI0013635B1D|nr:TonB-dependent receptor [Catenovulum agarivorans]